MRIAEEARLGVPQDQAVRLSDVVVLGGHARENLPTVLARALHRVINLRPTDWDMPRQVKVVGECLAALSTGLGLGNVNTRPFPVIVRPQLRWVRKPLPARCTDVLGVH